MGEQLMYTVMNVVNPMKVLCILYLNVFLLVRHGAILPVDLLANSASQTLVPVMCLLVDTVM